MNTEQMICDTLIDMMGSRPFEKIKVTHITERCGISRSTFYVYFDSIYSVLQKIEDEFLENVGDEALNVKGKFTQEELDRLFGYLQKNIKTMKALIGPNGDSSFRAKLANRNKRVLSERAKKNGHKLSDPELEIISQYSLAGKLQIFIWWAENENDISVHEFMRVAQELTDAINALLK